MVQRTSEALNIKTGGGVQAAQSSVGFANPDPNAYAKTSVISAPASSGADILLNSLLSAGTQITNAMMQKSMTEAYVDGAAKAALGKSEADLESNPIWRGWGTTGFRDTMGRLAMADSSAKITADMAHLREQPPEKFGEYLAQRRAELMPQIEGMSVEARKGMIANMVMDERAAIKKHGAEHFKFVEETQDRTLNVMADRYARELNEAKIPAPGRDAVETYAAAADAAWSGLYTSVHLNEQATPEKRLARTEAFAQQMLSSNNYKVYELMRDRVVTMKDGTQRTLLSELPSDTRNQLASQYKQALERTEGDRAMGFQMELVAAKRDWADVSKPIESSETVEKRLEAGYQKGYFGIVGSGEAMRRKVAAYEDYLTAASKRQGADAALSQFKSGNLGGVLATGKTLKETTDNFVETSLKAGISLPTVASTLVTHGAHTGWKEPLNKAGELMRPAWQQAWRKDGMDPQNAGMITNMMTAMHAAETAGQGGLIQSYVETMDGDTQELVMRVSHKLKEGYGGEAINAARGEMEEQGKLGPLRGALQAQAAKENSDNLATMTALGPIERMWEKGKSIFSSNAANRVKLGTPASWFENKEIVAEAGQLARVTVAEELNELTMTRPGLDGKSRFELAQARAAGRTVVTQWGALVIPKNRSMEDFFGVKDSERIGVALNSLLVPKSDGGRMLFHLGVNDELMVNEKRADGTMMQRMTIDPRIVKAKVEEMRKEEGRQYDIIHGKGETAAVKVDGKDFPITFNGRNGIGVDELRMHEFRSRLVKHEGVRDTPYSDVGGKLNRKTGKTVQTVGVGISDTNNYYPTPGPDGKITAKQASDALRDASEDAARAGNGWAAAVKLPRSNTAFQLFSELAFQGGSNNTQFNPLLNAIRVRDQATAMKALRDTRAWQTAGDGPRRKFYETSLNALFKE